MPVAPYETESAMEAPCDGHGRTLAMEALNLIPVFAFDFPCLRPPPTTATTECQPVCQGPERRRMATWCGPSVP